LVIADTVEISAFRSTVDVVQTQFCIRDALPVDTRHIEFEQEVLDGAIVT